MLYTAPSIAAEALDEKLIDALVIISRNTNRF
jgi:hypothetical protein